MISELTQTLSDLFNRDGEDRGVSPVIGVILMVAITVILAAVIGAFVLGLGGDLESSAAPTASISVSQDDSNIYMEHAQGNDITADELRVVLRPASGATTTYDLADDPSEVTFTPDTYSVGDTIQVTSPSEFTGGDAELVHIPSGTQLGSGEVEFPAG